MGENFIHNARQIILTKIGDEKFGVSELASQIGLSRSQVLRKLKAETGLSANEFIREIRLHEGKKLIKDTDLTASEIAFKVGFSSPSYFSKCFLKQFGVTPGEFRKQKKTDPSLEIRPIIFSKKSMLTGKRVLLFSILMVVIFTGYFWVVNPTNSISNKQASIAVLPLLDLSENKDKAYLADGITEAITLELSKYESLRVISRGSAMMYKDENKIYSEIAEELGVELLLEGSLLYEADSLRVVVQLIEPYPQEKHIWANSYHQNSSMILQLVADVSREIAGEISSVVEPNKNQTYQVDPKAYDLFLRGRHLCNIQKTRYHSLLKAMDYLDKAIDTDPKFAPAYITKAETYLSINKLIGDNNEKESNRQKAREAANKAIKLDDSLPEAYIALGNLHGKLDWDWKKMKKLVDKGLSLDPNSATGHQSLSDYYIVRGEYNHAIEEALMAEKLDPMNPAIRCLVAERYYISGNYQKSIKKYNEVLELYPDYGFAWNGIGYVYFHVGDEREGVESWRKLQDIMGNETLGSCYDNSDNYKDCFRLYLEKAKQNEPRFCANPTIISSIFMMIEKNRERLIT